jgi:hypothetical protein
MQEQFVVPSFSQMSVRGKGGKYEMTTQNWETVWGTTVPEDGFFDPNTGSTGRAKFFIPNNRRWDFIRLKPLQGVFSALPWQGRGSGGCSN